jgi:hypothetical protein
MVIMISGGNTATHLARAPAGALARARVWGSKYHVDHVRPFHVPFSERVAINMVQNGTKRTMPRLRTYAGDRPQLRPRNLFSGLNPRWRRLPLVLREELKTVLSCQTRSAQVPAGRPLKKLGNRHPLPAGIGPDPLQLGGRNHHLHPYFFVFHKPTVSGLPRPVKIFSRCHPVAAGRIAPHDCTAFNIISHQPGGGR